MTCEIFFLFCETVDVFLSLWEFLGTHAISEACAVLLEHLTALRSLLVVEVILFVIIRKFMSRRICVLEIYNKRSALLNYHKKKKKKNHQKVLQ